MRHKPRLDEKPTQDSPSAELFLHGGTSYDRGLTVLESTSEEAVKLKQNLDRVLAENDYSFDSSELWMETQETPVASSSSRCDQATITSTAQVMSTPKHKTNLNCESSSEEYFTPSLPSGNFRLALGKIPVVAADSFEEDFDVEETDLAENGENLPNNRQSASKHVSPYNCDDVPPKKIKCYFSKTFSKGKENTKVDENETVDSHNSKRVTATGSQCSIEPSHDFTADRCMLTTATGKSFIIALYHLRYG